MFLERLQAREMGVAGDSGSCSRSRFVSVLTNPTSSAKVKRAWSSSEIVASKRGNVFSQIFKELLLRLFSSF